MKHRNYSPSSPVLFPSLLLHFLPRLDRPRPPLLLLWFSALTLLLAWAGCNRFPEARAHYRPVGLAITCEASFDFVCASQHSFRLSTRPSEILRGSFERRAEGGRKGGREEEVEEEEEEQRERRERRESGNIQRNGSLVGCLVRLLLLAG